jgi:hypothetical protein
LAVQGKRFSGRYTSQTQKERENPMETGIKTGKSLWFLPNKNRTMGRLSRFAVVLNSGRYSKLLHFSFFSGFFEVHILFRKKTMSKNSKRRIKQELEKAAQRLLQKQPQTQKTEPSSLTRASQPDQTPTRFLWWTKLQSHPGVRGIQFSWKLLGWVLGALTLAIGLFVFFFPKISVVPSVFIDPKNPITSRFEVKNEGQLAIYDVYAHSVWVPYNRQKYGPNFEPIGSTLGFISTNKFSEVDSGISFVCHFDEFQNMPPLPVAVNYQIQILVCYKPKFWPWSITNTFEFTATKGNDGNFIVTPAGGGQRLESFITNPFAH